MLGTYTSFPFMVIIFNSLAFLLISLYRVYGSCYSLLWSMNDFLIFLFSTYLVSICSLIPLNQEEFYFGSVCATFVFVHNNFWKFAVVLYINIWLYYMGLRILLFVLFWHSCKDSIFLIFRNSTFHQHVHGKYGLQTYTSYYYHVYWLTFSYGTCILVNFIICGLLSQTK